MVQAARNFDVQEQQMHGHNFSDHTDLWDLRLNDKKPDTWQQV
eukprot:CAMPEP_0169269654 /NCGR_PEP_ID=MMETSP1016-20121227/48589_1 /TAXON_ID=342587 /ORGANISM="Karlodinium micrum, Strain CCMP2283" /LENGTH=42 /DNA_ID= /DNA_START= /DNA_END= /DNA_ORIENTATION=